MSSGGGGGGGGVPGGNGALNGDMGMGVREQAGLNPYRMKGFVRQQSGSVRVETPTLSGMKAKQGAIVSKFMTFFQRKFTLVVEMYESSFYRQKPSWDRIAEFVYTDLCNTHDLRKEVKDVQFHPVKMLLFIKFSEERWRDVVVERLQSEEGVTWSDYGVRVKGYSLDAEVKFIRLLGVSPETGEEAIKETFSELGIGEVIELKKGWLDVRRLPGVTNGTWGLRVKILDPDKIIPSYIHRRDEGELWSLNFEGRIFCCWKCGSGTHIGDKCRDHSRTFDEVFNGSVSDDSFEKPTWAAVVRSCQGGSEEQRQKVKDIETKIKQDNKRRDREREEFEELKRVEEEELERQKMLAVEEKQMAVEKARADAQLAIDHDVDWVGDSDEDDSLLVKATEITVEIQETTAADAEAAARERALLTAIKHRSWMEQRSAEKLVNASINLELDRIFGPGASKLAIEFHASNPEDEESNEIELTNGKEEVANDLEDESESSDNSNDVLDESTDMKSSTPTRQGNRRGRKRNKRPGGDSTSSISPIREPLRDSEPAGKNDKKFKIDESTEASQDMGEQTSETSENLVVDDDIDTPQEEGLQTSENIEDKSEWSSICEFWEHQDSLNSDSSLGRGKKRKRKKETPKSPTKSPGKEAERLLED